MRFGTFFISGASALLRCSRNWLVACAVSWLWCTEKTQLRVPGQSQASLAPQRDSFTRRWRSVLLLGGLLLPGLARLAGAQGNDLVFAALTPQANGLPVGQVQAILQDRHGFMWFGTQSGLVKYDGQTLIVYTHNPDDPHSLSDNNVLALCEDRHGTLWVGTNIGGLNRFERATDSFTRFQADAAKPGSLGVGAIRSICEDRAGALWISLRRGGLARFERGSETFTHFLPEPTRPNAESNRLDAILEDRQGNLWLGTAGGLAKFERDTQRFSLYTPDPQRPDTITKLYEDRAGVLWLATRRGLLRFEHNRGGFTRFTHNEQSPASLSSDFVRAIAEDQAGRLWVATENGLNRFEPASGRFLRYTNDPNDVVSLLDNWVVSLYRDRAGSLWIGTARGINRINRGVERFARYRQQRQHSAGLSFAEVSHAIEDSTGIIWIATSGGGLNKLDRRTGRIEVFRHDPQNPRSLSSDTVVTVYEDRTHILWVGTRGGGLNRFDRRTGVFPRYRFEPRNPASLSNDAVMSIYEDSAGVLWVGTLQGLNQFDRQRGQFIRYLHDPANPKSLSHNVVLDLLEGRDGSFWVATDGGGLNLLERPSGQFTAFKHRPADPASLNNNAVYSLAEDATGALWIATLGGGLNRLDSATTGRFTHYTEQDGLASNNVVGLLIDGTGALWMNTVQGVSRFDPRSGKFRRYTVRDGLASDTPTQKGQAQTRAGEVMLGGADGLTIFDPRQFADEPPLPPPVALTAFKKFDHPVNFGRDLAEVREIDLAERENFFSFEFVALDYKEPARNQYAYKLEGFDPDWIYCGTRRYAGYTNLNAGAYRFRVKAANSEGVWSEQDVSVAIRITPPFYRTGWFRLLILLAGAGSVGLVFKRRLDQAHRARRDQEEFSRRLIASQEAERKRIAAELHDSLGQDLLVIKNWIAYGLATLDKDNPARETLEEISTTTAHAVEGCREIAYNLRPHQMDYIGLAEALRAMLNKVGQASGLRIEAHIDDLTGALPKEAEINLFRIVQESLNNIVKHAHATEVSVAVRRDFSSGNGQPPRVVVEVRDNGRGFDPATLAQAQRGMGLSGILERAQMLGGTAVIDAAPGRGSTVAVTLPAASTAESSPDE